MTDAEDIDDNLPSSVARALSSIHGMLEFSEPKNRLRTFELGARYVFHAAKGQVNGGQLFARLQEIADVEGLSEEFGDDSVTAAMTRGSAKGSIEEPPPHPGRRARFKLADFLDRSSAEALVTEDSTALVFTERFGDALRFDHHRGKWYRWTGQRWECEETQLAFSWARQVARELRTGETAKVQAVTSRAAFAAAVERFALADRAFAVTSAIWDRDLWALNTPGGIVDLHSGKIILSEREAYCTKITAVAPGGKCERCSAS